MKTALDKALKNYQKECQFMVDTFIEWYYCDDEIKLSDINYYWFENVIGKTVFINNHFWNMDELMDIFTLMPEAKLLWKWQEKKRSISYEERVSIDFNLWLKLNQ